MTTQIFAKKLSLYYNKYDPSYTFAHSQGVLVVTYNFLFVLRTYVFKDQLVDPRNILQCTQSRIHQWILEIYHSVCSLGSTSGSQKYTIVYVVQDPLVDPRKTHTSFLQFLGNYKATNERKIDAFTNNDGGRRQYVTHGFYLGHS